MNQNTGSNNGNMSSPSSPMLGNTPLNLSSPSLSSAGSLTPQAQSQGQAQQAQQNVGNMQQQQQQRRAAHAFPRITPQQAHQLLRQFNIEKEGAQRAGINTPEGKQHVRKAERIKAILIQYNRKQKLLAAQRQQRREAQIQAEQRSQQQQQQGVALGGMMDTGGAVQGERGTSLDSHMQQQQQQQQQQVQQTEQAQQAQQMQQRSGNSNNVDLGSLTPAQQLQIQRQQQLAKYRQIIKLAEQFRNQLRAIETRKNVPNTPANLIAQLNQKEREIKSRMEQCRGYAQQIANRIRLMQQQQSNGVQSFGSPVSSGSSNAAGAQPQQFQGKLTAEQKRVLQQRILLEQRKRQELAGQSQQQDMLSQVKNAMSTGSMTSQSQSQAEAQLQNQQSASSGSATTKTKKKTPRKNQKKNNKTQTKKLTKAQKKLLKQNEAAAAAAASSASATAIVTATATASSATSAASTAQSDALAAGTADNTAQKGHTDASAAQKSFQETQITSVMPGTADTGSGTPRPRFQNITIPQDLKVSAPSAVSVKINNRPTLLGGNATDSPVLSNPAFIRPQHFEFEGGRVLNKRKLRELVKYVASEEGDTDVAIDGDVEELLLDLADEFVTSVTSFACRLAKHRKSNSLDVKDVQLHLERNWNIRVPGYAADEIRSTRKLMPNAAHNSKMNGLSINKSVNKGK